MSDNVIADKSYNFAVKIVKFCFEMQEKKKEFVISRQLLKSGTSIGANIEEAQGSISKPEFIAKIQISLNEARETHYWLRLIKDADVYQNQFLEKILIDCNEIIIIITSIIKTSKESLK